MAFRPYRVNFTTGRERETINFPGGFEKVPLALTTGMPAIGLTIGPDHCLYSTTVDGRIFRYGIAADGTLTSSQMINVVQRANWGPRMIPGIQFDPVVVDAFVQTHWVEDVPDPGSAVQAKPVPLIGQAASRLPGAAPASEATAAAPERV